MWLLSQGHTAVGVAAVTGYSAYWIGQIAKRYNTEDPAGMANRRHTASYLTPPLLSLALQEELRQAQVHQETPRIHTTRMSHPPHRIVD